MSDQDVMNHKRYPSRLASIVLMLLTTSLVRAQADSTYYLQLDCITSLSPDYVNVEKEIWLPVHQEMVDRGQKEGWTLEEVTFGPRDECDYYTANRYIGVEAISSASANLRAAFEKVHPGKNFDEAMTRTDKSRKRMSAHLRKIVGGIRPESFQYLHVSLMKAEDGDAYVNHEMSVFKPVHQAMVDDGITKGWYLEALVRPHGSAIGYNFTIVDFADNPGPIPVDRYVAKVHPDRSVEEIFQETEAVRELVLSKTMHVVVRTSERK